MNAIIWWLESPWQLRALVFALSFFVCFVAPWLHNQSVLTGRVAPRKPLEERSETVSAPKAEVPHQDAEAQAQVPAPQEQVTVQEKAAPASAEERDAAHHEQVPSRAEAPVHAMQVPAEALREEQASTPVPVAQAPTPAMQEQVPASAQGEPNPKDEQVPATAQAAAPIAITPAPAMNEPASTPAQVAPLAVEARAPTEPVQVPMPAQAPVATVPVAAMEERASAPAQAVAEEAPVVSEPKAPARQEQAVVQAPAPSMASMAQPASGFKIVSQSASVIPVPAGSAVEKQEFVASTENGGSAEVEVYVISNKAGRSLRRSNRVVDRSNGRAELSAVLDSDAFAKAAALYDTVACVGLGSRSTGLSPQEITHLIDNKAVQLCGIIARKPYVSTNTKLYGLPLGQQMYSARPEKETAEKLLIIIGLRNTKGALTDAAVQKKMVSEIIRGGAIANLPLSTYSEVASGKELRYIEVKGGNNNRPIKSSAVKPGYALQQELHRLFPARHKRCGASGASPTHLIRTKKVSRSHSKGEALGRRHPGCGLFDFPF